ncbi:MAG: beta-eliminating lyase-related protein [Spirochaetes bacterium]|nr:beta-eliminating lyase-related protein [Spirochaetota bacterium]
MKFIDLRSDTVTWPTPAMRTAMAAAEVGDDVYGDDPTLIELERLAAEIVGKEASLFVPSGTFGNQLALFTHCPRGSEVIIPEHNHIIQHEAGAAAIIAGVQFRTVATDHGILTASDVASRVRIGDDIHYPPTSLVCLENAHSSGRALTLAEMDGPVRVARGAGVPVHLDGARIFNAAAAIGADPREIAKRADSVMFCLSKGLCAPVGSILAGSSAFIAAARRKRKIMGGGLRQAGILGAAGIVALKDMRGRLADDHARAKSLARELEAIPGVKVDRAGLDINMVFFSVDPKPDPGRFQTAMLARGILVNPPEDGQLRYVTHYWIGDAQLPAIIDATRAALPA